MNKASTIPLLFIRQHIPVTRRMVGTHNRERQWEKRKGECGSVSGLTDLPLGPFFVPKPQKFKKQLLLPSLHPTACHVGCPEESTLSLSPALSPSAGRLLPGK